MLTDSVFAVEIEPHLLSSASKLAASAYFDNPAHIYMCPDDNTRFQKMEWLLGTNLQLRLNHGAKGFCFPEKGVVKAMGFWTQPLKFKIGLGSKIKGGLLKVPFKMGRQGFKKVMEVTNAIDDHYLQTMGDTQSYHVLNYFVMDESRRGKGWGTRILNQQIKQISVKEPSAILALNTQRYWTVKLYEKIGFEVLLEKEIGTGPLAFPNWTMRMQL